MSLTDQESLFPLVVSTGAQTPKSGIYEKKEIPVFNGKPKHISSSRLETKLFNEAAVAFVGALEIVRDL
jgi:hypothetical protein